MPSRQEIDEHDGTHIPYEPWCPICIAAKGVQEPHRTLEFRNEQVVLVDWTTFKSSGDFWKQDVDAEDQKWASEVTMTHRNTGMSLTMN